MKTRTLIVILNFFIFIYGQTYPLDTSFDDVVNNGYLKDLDNELVPYEGTWVYESNDTVIVIEAIKMKKYWNGGSSNNYYEDLIEINYKLYIDSILMLNSENEVLIEDEYGLAMPKTIIYSTGRPRFMDLKFQSNGRKFLNLSYTDGIMCGIHTFVRFQLMENNLNKVTWTIGGSYDSFWFDIEDCPQLENTEWPYILPKNMILTKVE